MMTTIDRWLDAITRDDVRDDLRRNKKAQNQIARAMQAPSYEFAEQVLAANLPEMVIQPSAKTFRDHAISRQIEAQIARGQPVDWTKYGYFTGPLSPVSARHEHYRSPSARVTLGRHQVFTYEYDNPTNVPTSVQFSWCRSASGKASGSVMGALFEDLSKLYADFAGITVVWSGNKSLHIHVVFSTDLIPALPPEADLNDGIKRHWHDLLAVVARHTGHASADQSCAGPTQFRRLPWGTHANGNPQVVLWERYRGQARRGTSCSFFQPQHFAVSGVPKARSPSSTSIGVAAYNGEEMDHITTRLGQHFPGFPRLSHIEHTATGYRAMFWNTVSDRTPSSYMRENARCVALVGSGSEALHDCPILPAPLGQMMAVWADEVRTRKLGLGDVQTYPEARAAIDYAVEMIAVQPPHEPVLLQAPEGAGKTTAAMRHHDAFARGRRSLYAFGSYDLAAEKCAEFNDRHSGDRYFGMVIHSWTQLYAMCADHLGYPILTTADAARRNLPSLFVLVSIAQPEVLTSIATHVAAVRANAGERTPVFFTVHDVAHGWLGNSPTRMIWSTAFWRSKNLRDPDARAETALAFLLHDEVKVETFLDIIPARLHRLAKQVANAGPTLSARAKGYMTAMAQWRGGGKPSFDVVRQIISRLDSYQPITVSGRGSYPTLHRQINPHASDAYLSLYAADGPTAVREWMVAQKRWYRDGDEWVADRILFLTTEALPVACCPDEIGVLPLRFPNLPSCPISVIPSQGFNGVRLEEVLGKVHDDLTTGTRSRIRIVSNCVEEITTHAAAKGSNALAGQNILQTAMFSAPFRHEQMCALNDFLGRDDCVLLDHIDTINQTAGRNLGFRWDGQARHYLLINRHLWALIQSSPARNALRYDPQEDLSVDERRNRKRGAAKRGKMPAVAPRLCYDGSGYDGSGYTGASWLSGDAA